MKELSLKQKIALIIYVIGVFCVAILLIRALIGGENVSNPQAMLPVTDFEANLVTLGIGFIPMLISTIVLMVLFNVKKLQKCFIILIPCIITAIPFVILAGTLILMLIKGYIDVILGI